MTGGELDRALELAERNREVAYASGDRLLRLQAHHGLWTTHFVRGELHAALEHLDAGEPMYEPADGRAAIVYGLDPKTTALGYRALTVFAMGAADRAVALMANAVVHALALGHPSSVAQAMVFSAFVRMLRREPAESLRDAETALAYSATFELPFWMPNALAIRGWALVQLGRTDEGMAEWRRGAELWSRVRGVVGRTAYDAVAAEMHLRAGQLAEARPVIESCKARIVTNGERYQESEVYRIEAAVVLAEAAASEREGATSEAKRAAETLLRRAVDVAHAQGACAYELRAATALARLRPDEPTRTRLAAVIASVAAGGDTADLQEARGVLAVF